MMMSREERLRHLRELYADVAAPAQSGSTDRHIAARSPASVTIARSAAARSLLSQTRPEGGISDKAAAVIAEALKNLLRS